MQLHEGSSRKKDAVTPCFWFDGEAFEAISFYVSVFPNSRVVGVSRYGEGAPVAEGTVMTIDFELQGRPFMAINGGPQFQFSPAISMIAYCDDQAEVDRLWEALSVSGEKLQCGWLTDQFGVSWQVVPTMLCDLMNGDPERSNRVMKSLWGMEKLDIRMLQAAADGFDL